LWTQPDTKQKKWLVDTDNAELERILKLDGE
jgi:hypothetical protein